MMRMAGVAMMAGTVGLAFHLAYQIAILGMQALETAQLVQAVLETSLGQSMMSMGAPLAFLGTCIQWVVAFIAALVYVLAARVIPFLFSFPMSLGAVYGFGVSIVSSYVLPLWLDPNLQLPPLAGQLAGLGVQALLFGIPMAFTAKTMMSDQAADSGQSL
jgi:predicted Kef-type K+ transport protein